MRRTIVCLSSQRWDDGMWTNKQHIMSRLAKDHDVVYVSFGPIAMTRRWGANSARWRHPLRTLTWPTERDIQGTTVLDFYAPQITERLAHGTPVRNWAEYQLRITLLRDYLVRTGRVSPIVWVYHPGYGNLVRRLPHSLVVYDCVDEYAAFPEFAEAKPWIRSQERALCQTADLVFCTSAPLFEAKKALKPDATHLVHNVGDAAHFKKASLPGSLPSDLPIEKPVIMFIGAIADYKLNIDWLAALADARPRYNLVLIGPVGHSDPSTDASRLAKKPNVFMLGHRSYDVLPDYLRGAAVAVIPYRLNEYTTGVFPIKFFELLATGKPVVVSKLPALETFLKEVYVADTTEEFVSQVDRAVEAGSKGAEARIALAEENSWPSRIKAMMTLIEARLAAG